MKVGVHELERGLVSKWSQKYIAILDFNEIEWELLSLDDLEFWDQVKSCTHFIYHWGGSSDAHQKAHIVLPVIEFELGIPVFPAWNLSWHYDDKIKGYCLLHAHDFPAIKSWIFLDKKKALNWVDNFAKLPVVVKLSRGAGSQDVTLIQTKKHARRIIRKMFGPGVKSGNIPGNDLWVKQFNLTKIVEKQMRAFYRVIRGFDAERNYHIHKNYVLFQKFLPGNTFDTRVTTIGDRAFAFRRFNRKNDFRASGSGNIDYDVESINLSCIEIALTISESLNFSCMTYDFLFDENGSPQIAEISYTFIDVAVYGCPGYWDNNLNWHEGHYWPEYLQLVDFLQIPELKCPEFKE